MKIGKWEAAVNAALITGSLALLHQMSQDSGSKIASSAGRLPIEQQVKKAKISGQDFADHLNKGLKFSKS
jgi:hypothetical protein